MFRILDINWLSKEAKEAEVLISDGKLNILCFCQPCNLSKNGYFEGIIHALDTFDVFKAENNTFKVEKIEDYFSYLLEGKLINKEKGVVKLGKLTIEIYPYAISGDINEGDFISFKTTRLDLY